MVVKLILEGSDQFHPLGAIIEDCRDLVNRDWDCKIIHNYREGNCCASFLSKMGSHSDEGFFIFDDPPEGLRQLRTCLGPLSPVLWALSPPLYQKKEGEAPHLSDRDAKV